MIEDRTTSAGGNSLYERELARMQAAAAAASTAGNSTDTATVDLWVSKNGKDRVPLTIDMSSGSSIENQALAMWSNPDFLSNREKKWVENEVYKQYGYVTNDKNVQAEWVRAFNISVLNGVPIYTVLAAMSRNDPGFGVGSSGGGGGAGGGGGGSATTTSYDYTSPDVAKALLNSALTTYLGRAARPDEIDNFKSALKQAESENPIIVTSDGSTRTQTGGMDAQAFVQDYAKQQPEYGDYQAATTYMDTFMQALGQ